MDEDPLSTFSSSVEDGDDAEALGLDTAPPEFYDPEADEKDEKWAAKLRRGRKSDAILSCPLCFTTVCIDCQQHATNENQFRAMFVMNCKVITRQIVRPAADPAANKKQQSNKANEEKYHPVQCVNCDTELGLREIGADGVYHFFNVVASNS